MQHIQETLLQHVNASMAQFPHYQKADTWILARQYYVFKTSHDSLRSLKTVYAYNRPRTVMILIIFIIRVITVQTLCNYVV